MGLKKRARSFEKSSTQGWLRMTFGLTLEMQLKLNLCLGPARLK